MIRKPYIPGLHGRSRRKGLSEYAQQLIEKQKVRHTYGISENQFKKYFKEIASQKGNQEELLTSKIEKRLDNVVYRLGWVQSRRLARQTVSHGHILVNQRKVNIPSYQVKKGDLIKIKASSQKLPLFQDLKTALKKYETPAWLLLDKQKLEGKIIDQPQIADLNKVGQIGMIIEYYSR